MMRWWRRNTPDDPVRLTPIGVALLLMLALAATTVVLLGVATVAVLGLPRPDPRGPTVAEFLEALKIALALVAGVGVVVALVVAYRRQRVLEEENVSFDKPVSTSCVPISTVPDSSQGGTSCSASR